MNTIDRITAGAIAQQLERPSDKRKVKGAIPFSSTKSRHRPLILSQLRSGGGVMVSMSDCESEGMGSNPNLTPKLVERN